MLERDVRPWGEFLVVDEGAGFKVKRIVVNPGGRLSLQRHLRRAEHWTVALGVATATVGDRVVTLDARLSIDIQLGAVHRLENLGPTPLHLIEVQFGDYLSEDDIIRYDDYARD